MLKRLQVPTRLLVVPFVLACDSDLVALITEITGVSFAP